MTLENLGQETSPGTFYHRIYDAREVKIDRYIVRPGVTAPFHGNANDEAYTLVACTTLKFLSVSEDGRINEYRHMEPGEQLKRPRGFRHTLINVSDRDFVVLKIWPTA